MSKHAIRILLVYGAFAVVLAIGLAACGAAPTPCPACPACETCPTCPPEKVCPEPEVGVEAPFEALWATSPHNDVESEAFNHWNEEDPAEVAVACAKCHSTPGFQDYVGADGSEAFVTDKAAAIGTTITCVACHNEATADLSKVVFPSGAEITGLGGEAVCMTCHQGMASMVQVDKAIADAAPADDDTPTDKLGFTNPHYFAAAIARFGTKVKGGYEYAGQAYDAQWLHVEGVNTCTDCHDSHSLELKVETCAACHTGVASAEDVRKVRMASSVKDYDGDGDVTEGIAGEVEGLQAMLMTAIQTYATEVVKMPVVYKVDAYPYFFNDTNADGQPGEDEAVFPNAYKSWTGRMLKAAYNYQTSIKDPGSYAHGGKYIIELLFDSIADLNTKLATPVDLSKASRTDPGHFDGSAMAFRDWDSEGMVPAGCVKCHSAVGLPQFIANAANISMPVSDGLQCETCHNDLTAFTLYEMASVTFPSGAKATFNEGETASNLCLACHQGRESTVSVNKKIAGKDPDTADEKLTFSNVHYFAAGATLFGTTTKGMYEYAGKEYAGQFAHVAGFATCVSCHDAHGLEPKVETCAGCHQTSDPSTIRMSMTGDYDGDGDTTEGLKGELDGNVEALYKAIQAYATTITEKPIAYNAHAYPYFFNDTNANGVADPEESIRDNGYKGWTPRLLQAAYNFQYAQKDPGAYVHNAKYVLQALNDSIKDLGTKVPVEFTGVRP